MAVSQEWQGRLILNKIGWVSVIYDHDRDLLVTKVRRKELPYNDRGESSGPFN